MLPVCGLLTVGVAAAATGATWAGPLTAAAGAVHLAVAAATRLLATSRGAHARTLIERARPARVRARMTVGDVAIRHA